VGLTFICALATLAVLRVLSANIPQVLPPPDSQVLNAALLTGIAALISMLGASSAAHSLIALQIRERQARQAKQALCESEERYRLIAENTSDLIALLDAEGRYLYISPSFARELGHMPAALVGVRRYDLIHPDDLLLALAYWHQARRRGSAQSSYRVRHANGEWRWLEVCLTTAMQQGREYIILVARDITARRALEAQLQQAQKLQALGHLATGVAHDFNNLLVVINGSVELTAAVLPANHPAQADLNAAQQASKRAGALTHQLLAFARRQPTTPRLVHLGDVVRESGQMLERLMGEAITLVINVASDGWPVWADPSQIEQVLMNLAVNARDAMPEGGTLAISVANCLRSPIERTSMAPLPYVCMMITDTGVGISQEVHRHLFEPFFTTKAPEKGTGLGLAICYGIVTQAGGEITVSSAVGAGTTFTILLPRAADRPNIDNSLTGHDDSAQSPRDPLVLEDETAVRRGSDPARRAHAQLQCT
jgi:PAS domain S-box-containing protein